VSDFTRRIADFTRTQLVLLGSKLHGELEGMRQAAAEPIAIVGMACRFPGEAAGLEAFWRVLHHGVDAVTPIPLERWDVDEFFDPDPRAEGKMYCRHGGFVEGVDRFDAPFFNISPREAKHIDPQHRLLLEVAWEALENAGQDPTALRGSRSGVFIGFGAQDYANLQVRHLDPTMLTAYTGTGNAYCYGAGRLSYFLGLQGANFPVETACSSSLVALHLACQSLRVKECDLALVGGVHLMLAPVAFITLCKAQALAPDGRCKTFDRRADGYARGEGCGVVVLRRLSDAVARRDPIHAQILGSAVNHDGPSSGFTVPNGPAQKAVIQSALARARVEPAEVGYVEAHGTGTSLGDPIEVRALADTLGRRAGRAADQPLVLGSVKTNIGHLEPAAGIAGLIKAALALAREEIPPHVHFREPNPMLPLAEGPFEIPTAPRPWKRGAQRRVAGVSSFGLSGTNAHVVLAEAPPEPPPARSVERPLHLLTLSARDGTALRELAGRYADFVERRPEIDVGDLCFTANAGRAHFKHRLAVTAAGSGDLMGPLRRFAAGEAGGPLQSTHASSRTRPKVVFLFTGQGSQMAGVGRSLYDHQPVFRRVLDRCAELLRPDLAEPLPAVLFERGDLLQETAYTQPCLFALEYALVELWRSWGIEPAAVIGHSLGEYVAACVAGVFTLEDGLKLVARRARWMQDLPRDGEMAAVEADGDRLAELLRPHAGKLGIAAWNGPRSVVISGERERLRAVTGRLAAEGVRVRPLAVSHAFHSPLMAPVRDDLARLLATIPLRPPRLPLLANLTGEPAGDEMATAEYWCRHLLEPVRFEASIRRTAELGYRVFLEIGPQPTLLGLARRSWPQGQGAWLPSLRPDREWETLVGSLAALYLQGAVIDWEGFDEGYWRHRRELPTYPFQRQSHWVDLPGRAPRILLEKDARDQPSTGAAVGRLLSAWGNDGVESINRQVTAPYLFLAAQRQGGFFFNQYRRSLLAATYLGPPEAYGATLRDLITHARERDLDLTLFGEETQVATLQELEFSTTPIGVWQSLQDVRGFTLQGGALRNLRSKVHSYRNAGGGPVTEYVPGGAPEVDRAIVALMDDWMARKGKRAPFVASLKEQILSGRLDRRYRLFRTERDGAIESVLLLSPIEARNGYLMDLEFYRADMRPGCLEHSIVTVLGSLAAEGKHYFSLGSTFGTQLVDHPNADPRVRDMLLTLHRQKILNEDSNYSFKKKFNPVARRLYLCRPRASDPDRLAELLLDLATNPAKGAEIGEVLAEPGIPAHPDRALAARPAPVRATVPAARLGHPLLGRRLPLAQRDPVFEAVLDLGVEDLAYLADHRIFGQVLLPATGFLEMVLAATRTLRSADPLELRDLRLLEALVLSPGPRRVQLVLQPAPAGGTRFQVLSAALKDGDDDPGWALHVTGDLVPGARVAPGGGGEPLAAVQARCQQPMPVDEFYRQSRGSGIDYGESFRGLHHLATSYGEAVGHIHLPERVRAHGSAYRFHPALLDAGIQVQAAALMASAGDEGVEERYYLPASIERVRFHGRCGDEMWSHARIRPREGTDLETLVGDLRFFGPRGELVAEVEGFQVRRTRPEVIQLLMQKDSGDLLYELEWRPLEPAPELPEEVWERPGYWLLLTAGGGLAPALAELLGARGETCFLVYPSGEEGDTPPGIPVLHADPARPEDFPRLFREAAQASGRPCHGVVHLWGAEGGSQGPTLEALQRAQRVGCAGVLHLLQALAAEETVDEPRLWLVTRDAQPVGATPALGGLGQATLWGLGRSIAQEHSEVWGGMIDLGSEAEDSEAVWLAGELCARAGEDQLAFRHGQRYGARLVPSPRRTPRALLTLDRDRTHLLTGGLGGLGLAVARFLVERGARHLALVGRSAPSPAAAEAVAAMEAAGARVRVFAADVAARDQLAQVLEEVRRTLPPLAGIVHAAGVLADGALLQQSWSGFQTVLVPKLEGAWHLHELTRDHPLDYFLLFSSLASLLGGAGQGNYAAANAFLDGLSHLRRAQGLTATSIQWGPWGEIGMSAAVGSRVEAQRAAHGIGTLSPRQGLELLEQLLQPPAATQIAAVSVDWARLLEAMPRQVERSSLLKDLARAAGSLQTDRGPGELVLGLFAEPPEERPAALEAYLQREAGRVLGLDPQAVDRTESLSLMGFDSLMVLELREKVEDQLGVSIPVAHLFRGDSVADLARHLLGELSRRHPELAAGVATPVVPATGEDPPGQRDLEAEARLEALRVDPGVAEAALERVVTPSTLFLTGATGFVGAFVLRELLECTGAQVLCLVRAGDELAALDRIRKNCNKYGVWDEGYRARVIPVPGDLTKDRLGLPAPRFDALAERIDVIYHLAAVVNLAYKYELLKPTNVDGTRQVLRLAATGRIKPVNHLSSYAPFDSVHNAGRVFSEEDVPRSDGLPNGYCESKWVSERMVRHARDAGLPVAIYRVGWVAGHSQTGAWNTADFLFQLIQACIGIGRYCHLGKLTLTPVDYLARSLVHLSERPESFGEVHHLSNGRLYRSEELFELVNEFGYDLAEVPYEAWEEAMRRSSHESSLAPMALFLESLQGTKLSDWFSREPGFSVDRTRRRLADSGIEPPELTSALVGTYLGRLVATGLIAAPS
jgi:thioester reductase-like protein